MQKIRLFLNIMDRNVNVLFDKDTGARFTLSRPYVEVSKVSKGIKRSIAAGRVIDIDNVTGIEVNSKTKAIHDKLLALAHITRVSEYEKSESVDETGEMEQEKNFESDEENVPDDKEEDAPVQDSEDETTNNNEDTPSLDNNDEVKEDEEVVQPKPTKKKKKESDK